MTYVHSLLLVTADLLCTCCFFQGSCTHLRVLVMTGVVMAHKPSHSRLCCRSAKCYNSKLHSSLYYCFKQSATTHVTHMEQIQNQSIWASYAKKSFSLFHWKCLLSYIIGVKTPWKGTFPYRLCGQQGRGSGQFLFYNTCTRDGPSLLLEGKLNENEVIIIIIY